MGNALIVSDVLAMRGWAREHTWSKALVVMGFLVTLGLVSWGIYSGTLAYFRLIADYDVFGRAVITYTMHASILLVLVLSVFSGMAVLYNNFYTDQRLKHWFSVPVSAESIWRTGLVRTAMASSWPLLVVLLPMILALARTSSHYIWITGIFMLILLLVLSLSLSALLVVLLVRALGSIPRVAWILMMGLVVVGLILLLKLLFPPAFFKLYLALDERVFMAGLERLPLFSRWLPSWWLASLLTDGVSWISFLPLGLSGILLMWFEQLMQSGYETDYRRISEGVTYADTRTLSPEAINRHWPEMNGVTNVLFMQELLGLGRQGADLLYAVFITAMGIVYVALISYVTTTQPVEPRFVPWLTGSLLIGFGFLVTVMMARFAYPLMAKEAKAAWFLLSAPLPRSTIVESKLLVAVTLLLPWLGVGLFGALVMPVLGPDQMMLFWLMAFMGLVIAVVQLSLGVIAPNFAEGEHAEHTSTSGSGLLATMFSLSIVFTYHWVWQRYSLIHDSRLVFVLISASILVGGSLFYGALRAVERYQRI
jgi:hypothetical protein